MKKRKLILVFFGLLLLNSLLAQEISRHRLGTKQDFRSVIAEVPEHDFDVLHYQFDWKIDFDSRHIQGKALIRSQSLVDGLNMIWFDLADNMSVIQIKENGEILSYSHLNNRLEIFLNHDYKRQQEIEVEITYSGFPSAGLYYGFHEDQPIIWSLDEPSQARNWFPCFDHPTDKATLGMNITVPMPMVVASNGTLVDVAENADNTTTYAWQEDYPISTYLISVAATNYKTLSETYITADQTLDIVYYVYPEQLSQAREDLSVTPAMMEFYSQVFGEYPFIKEKYGTAIIPGSVSMEHQTCTSYSSRLITGQHSYDYVIAHELAHQWWGDLVSPSDWADIWLNEGFASYSEALWWENLYGAEGLRISMAEMENIYFTYHQGPEHPIYDPPQGHLFCAEEYDKAACVLHMFRFVVGEDNFWKILKKYAMDFAYSTATTEDFKNLSEQVSGADLDWFFDQWIYQAGYPVYVFGWGYSDRKQKVMVVINQTQDDFPLFEMPIPLRIDLPSGPVTKIVWVKGKNNSFEFALPERPSQILFDPDGWILCKVQEFRKKGTKKR